MTLDAWTIELRKFDFALAILTQVILVADSVQQGLLSTVFEGRCSRKILELVQHLVVESHPNRLRKSRKLFINVNLFLFNHSHQSVAFIEDWWGNSVQITGLVTDLALILEETDLVKGLCLPFFNFVRNILRELIN